MGHSNFKTMFTKKALERLKFIAKLNVLLNIVQMVQIGWISRSRGQKIGFQNAIFKNLLV